MSIKVFQKNIMANIDKILNTNDYFINIHLFKLNKTEVENLYLKYDTGNTTDVNILHNDYNMFLDIFKIDGNSLPFSSFGNNDIFEYGLTIDGETFYNSLKETATDRGINPALSIYLTNEKITNPEGIKLGYSLYHTTTKIDSYRVNLWDQENLVSLGSLETDGFLLTLTDKATQSINIPIFLYHFISRINTNKLTVTLPSLLIGV